MSELTVCAPYSVCSSSVPFLDPLQDLLVASLFRNFLLAERIMRAYNCQPVSQPALPATFHHPMWQAWDMALDMALAQLPAVHAGQLFKHSSFFAQQLTAFQVGPWLFSTIRLE